jgi:homocysteine S-methyltransferase
MATPKYRDRLPQASNRIFLTDGGMETTLIYHDGIDLPCFAAFTLLDTPEGIASTRAYYAPYAAVARRAGLGFVLETPTWRANSDWGAKLGYSRGDLPRINRQSVELMLELRQEFETPQTPVVISGAIGPRGDGYDPSRIMSAQEAQDYHAAQIDSFRDTAADLVTAFTLNYVNEGIGVACAAKAAGVPAVISFTVETDGRLPTGETLKEAVTAVDRESGAGLLHGQLRAPHTLPRCACVGRALGEAHRRPARERLAAQPCRARSGDGARCRRSRRVRPPIRRAAAPAAAGHRARRLLRHRPPACRADRVCLPRGGVRPPHAGSSLSKCFIASGP